MISKLIASLDNHNKGFSARKLTAFATMWLIAYCHQWVSIENVVEVLMIDCAFVLLLLGIITMQQITEFKHGKQPTNEVEQKI